MSVAIARNSLFVTTLVSSFCLADSVHVAMNGVDSASCGFEATPCRTITRGIANAPVGGTVLVHPGLYGELGNQQLGDPGEEAGTANAIISIAKPVVVISSGGAEVTTIDANHSRDVVVEIASNDVTFGGSNAGFTLTNGSFAGIQATGGNITILHNVARHNDINGFDVNASGIVRLRGNYAASNGVDGFHMNGMSAAGHAILKNNTAVSNDGDGFVLAGSASAHQLISNTSSVNGTGVYLFGGPFVVQGNTITGNNTGVFFDSDANAAVSHNDIIGNRALGVQFFQTVATIQLHGNNIYGTAPAFGDAANACGLQNLRGVVADVSNNYWGAATGPGPKPADNLCGDPVVSTPFATQPFDVTAN